MLSSVDSILLIDLPHFYRDDGDLVVMEADCIPFSIARVFTVRADPGVTRGQHAHRQCTQFMTCSAGGVEVHCDDGKRKSQYLLTCSNQGLLVPASIWVQQDYKKNNTILTVLCDRPYEAKDYIHDYAEFLAFREPDVPANIIKGLK